VNNFGLPYSAIEEQKQTYRSWANNQMGWNVNDQFGDRIDKTDGITMAPFYKYTSGLAVYKCPADNYVSSKQSSAGIAARPRSYSMNGFFGVYDPGVPSPAGNNNYPTYRQFLKQGAIPTPSGFFVTCDEHPDSINDGFLQANPHTDVAPSKWDDLPATYHGGAGGFAFADGHSEIHKFKSSVCTILPVRYITIQNDSTPPVSQDPVAAANDVLWVANRASVPLQ
jgi:prepilin-type processing-associated H-X9-DG protein